MSRAGYITPHFPWSELRCHDGTDVPDDLVPNAVRLCGLLENIRILWGGALLVVSGYRTPVYNVRIRGAEASRHVTAEAADIRPLAMDRLADLIGMVRANLGQSVLAALGGWGTYPGWIHVDVRPRGPGGHIAYWTGTGLGSEVA